MYQVTQSQTASNIKLIECVKKYKQLWDSSDPNYKVRKFYNLQIRKFYKVLGKSSIKTIKSVTFQI